jgi:hypothetical protein
MFGVRPGATFAESSMPAGVGAARGDGKVPRRTAAMKAHLVFLYCAVNRGPRMHVRVRRQFEASGHALSKVCNPAPRRCNEV